MEEQEGVLRKLGTQIAQSQGLIVFGTFTCIVIHVVVYVFVIGFLFLSDRREKWVGGAGDG